MKFLNTELQTTLVDMHRKLPEIIIQSFTHLNGLRELSKILLPEEEYIDKYGEEPYFEEFRLDNLEEYEEIPSPDLVFEMGENLGAGSEVLNRRLKAFKLYYEKVLQGSEDITIPFIPMTEEQRVALNANVTEALGNLVTFIYYQFSIDTTLNCIIEETEVEIDLNLYNYLEKESLDIKTTVLEIKELLTRFRPTLPLFDEKPELEEPFYDIAGPYIHDFDVLEEYITLSDVMLVLEKPELDVEKFVKGLERRVESFREK